MRRAAQIFINLEWLWILLLLPPLMFPSHNRSLLLLFLPLLWLLRWITTGQLIPKTPLNLSLLFLGISLLLSLYAVFDIDLSLPKIAGLTLGISLFYSAIHYSQQKNSQYWHLLAVILLIGTGMAIIGLFGSNLGYLDRLSNLLPTNLQTIPGTIGGTINPNQLAGVMNWVAPLALASLLGFRSVLWRKNRIALLLLAGITLLMLLSLLLTLSRGGILGLFVSIIVMISIQYRSSRWLLIIISLAGLVAIFTFGSDTIFSASASGADAFGLAGRFEIWSRALYGIADFPFTGMSMNGFRRVVHILYPLFLVSPDTDLAHAHNHFLQVGVDLGLIGLTAYFSTWLLSALLLRQSWKRATTTYIKTIILGLAGSMAGYFVFGIFDTISLGAKPGFLWWLILAFIVIIHDITSD